MNKKKKKELWRRAVAGTDDGNSNIDGNDDVTAVTALLKSNGAAGNSDPISITASQPR